MTNAAPVTVYVNNIKYIGNADVPWDSNNSYFSSKLTYIDGKVYYEDKPLYKDGVAVLSTDYPDEAYYDTIGDLTGYTWVGNDEMDIEPNEFLSTSLQFTCNLTTYVGFGIGVNPQTEGGKAGRLYYGFAEPLLVYNGAWDNVVYKTIIFTGGADVTNSTLISWLENNGTLTAPVVQSTGKIVVGTKQVKKIYIGTKKVKKVYVGTKLSYEDNN